MLSSNNPEVQEILDRVMRGEDKPPPTPKKPAIIARKPSPGPGMGKGPRPSARKYDYDEIKRLYVEEEMRISYIAEKLGASTPTIRSALQYMGVYVRDRDVNKPKRAYKGGPNPQQTCKRGHSMDDAYVYNTPRGRIRQCRPCTQARQAARWAAMDQETRRKRQDRQNELAKRNRRNRKEGVEEQT